MTQLSRRLFLSGAGALVASSASASASGASAQAAPAVSGAGLRPADYLRGGDVRAALEACAEAAVRRGAPMWIDRDYSFNGSWRPPSGLMLRGPYTSRARLIAPDGIEVTGAIDIDGVVVDGGEGPGLDRSAALGVSLLAIHGPLGPGRSRYLPGVRVGRLRVRRFRGAGLVLANLDQPRFGLVEIEDIACHGSIWSGLRGARLDQVVCHNVGDLLPSKARRGAAMLIATETKTTAPWYTPDLARAMLPTDGVTIGSVDAGPTTDSAFYVHDDFKTGVRNIAARSILVRGAGKDGVKFRAGPQGIRLGAVRVVQVGEVGLSFDGVTDARVETVDIQGFGKDTVSRIIGRPARFAGNGGPGQTISDAPIGISIDNSRDITIGDFQVADGNASPDRQREGHGLRIYSSQGIKAKGEVKSVDGNAVRLCGVSDFDIDVTSDAVAGGGFRTAVLVAGDRGPSANGQVRVRQTGDRRGVTGFRVDDQSVGITADLPGDVTTQIARGARVALRRS